MPLRKIRVRLNPHGERISLANWLFEVDATAIPLMNRLMTFLRSVGVSIAVVLATAISAPPVFAGARASAHVRRPVNKVASRTDTGPAPTSAELNEFAHAVVAVGNIKRAARQGITSAPTRADRSKLEQATTGEIKAAIRSNHLSVHRYLQIITFVQTHPATQKKVVALLKQLMPPLPPQQPLNP